jgi:hypothetical protein
MAGGVWHEREKRFLDPETEGDAETYVEIPLAESQVEFARWFAEWLCDYREGFPRDTTVAMVADDRRGGKTFVGVSAIVSGCIDVPISPITHTPTLAAIVTKSYRERFEVEQWILERVPEGKHGGFYRHRSAPEHQFVFHSGAVLRLLSADDPDAIKQGRFDLIFFNEPQLVHPRAVANGVMATADLGGLAILGANPPGGGLHGEWMFDLKEAIDDERIARATGRQFDPLGIRYFSCPSRLNQFIDQEARRRAGRIGGIIDPTIKAGDVEGSWQRPIERACWEFDKHRHLHAEPIIGRSECTAKVASERTEEWGDWTAVAGIDFQDKPHIVCVVWKCFGDPDAPTFWAVDEFAGEKRWTVEVFLEAFAERFDGDPEKARGYKRDRLLWVGDASSDWQGTKHDFEGGERDSFAVVREDGWTIVQPSPSKNQGKKPGRGRNPFVNERLDLFNELLRQDRIRIDPVRCPWFSECVSKAATKRETTRRVLVGNKHAHALDAGTYPIWRLAAGTVQKAPERSGASSVDTRPESDRWY